MVGQFIQHSCHYSDKLSKLPELDELNYYQMMDRLHTTMVNINNHIQQNPVSKIDTEVKDHVCHAVDHLFRAYKLVEAKLNKDE